MDNRSFLDKLKFSVSDSSLHYYLYNWMCPSMSPDKVMIAANVPPPVSTQSCLKPKVLSDVCVFCPKKL